MLAQAYHSGNLSALQSATCWHVGLPNQVSLQGHEIMPLRPLQEPMQMPFWLSQVRA